MNLGCVQEWDPWYVCSSENQRQFGSSQNHSSNAVTLPHPFYDRKQSLPGLGEKNALHQFSKVFDVNVGLLIWFGCDQPDAFPGKHLWVEPPLHGETGSQQAQLAEPHGLGRVAGGFDDANQRQRRLLAKFVENQVRRVGRDYGEMRSRSRES